MNKDNVYALKGDTFSDQAEPSSANPIANTLPIRILVELQVISYLLSQSGSLAGEDLRQLRQNFADSIS